MDEKRQQGRVDQRASLDGDLEATLRHGAAGDGGAGLGAIEEQQASAAWQQERALTRSLSCRVEHCRKPPWYVIRMPGGVRGELHEGLPYSIALPQRRQGVDTGPSPGMTLRARADFTQAGES